MATYAFEPRSDLKDLAAAHVQRGFRVVVVGRAWKGVQALAQALGLAPNRTDTLVVPTLARQVYEKGKAGATLFDRPTLLMVDDAGDLGSDSLAWTRIQDAARAAPCDVVFAHVPTGR